ncbi:hypothetical protein [Helicobacter pylori]|uniref:hypothetical protein n=1 Tax=Helicobacter pylori TaxID=210 RepID=UPI001898AD38|nr:hypothetical protein [Helicobacter pylori]
MSALALLLLAPPSTHKASFKPLSSWRVRGVRERCFKHHSVFYQHTQKSVSKPSITYLLR